MDTVGAPPSRMRGVCGVIETAWNGDDFDAPAWFACAGCESRWHSSQVPFTAR